MKKIYYLLILAAITFASCQKQPVIAPEAYTKAMTFTLATSDYQLLPATAYPYKSFSFKSNADANLYIPQILNLKEPQLGNGSTANITYTVAPAAITIADSLFNDVSYTVTTADYAAVTKGTFKDFSPAQTLSFLAYKYPAPVANQLAVITYTDYESGITPSAGTLVTNSFLYLNGAWQKIYQVSAAQYTSVNRGSFGNFIAADVPNLASYFNTFLKADASIMDTVKANDVEYISYKYYLSPTNYQKVLALTYDGSNWTTASTQATLSFLKNSGTWIADPTVHLTLSSADYTYIGSTSAGTAAARANVAQYKDFNISATTDATYWSPTDLQNAFIALLNYKYPKPINGQIFNLTYAVYKFGVASNVTNTYTYNGTAFVFVK